MKDKRAKFIDRRAEKDRREGYDLNYMIQGGVERRKMKERRSHIERREGWIRVSEWHSICEQTITKIKKSLK